MLVQMRAVEIDQPVRIGGKVRRHPVENHANAVPVQMVDEVHEILRGSVARGRREIPGRLVTPGAVKRVLGDGHELHVRETQSVQIVAQSHARVRGSSRNCRPCAATTRCAARRSPSARRVRCARRASASTRRRSIRKSSDHTRDAVAGGASQKKPSGSAFSMRNSSTCDGCDICRLVPAAPPRMTPSQMPDPSSRTASAIARTPTVPIADHRDGGGIGRPYAEMGAGAAVEDVASEAGVEVAVGPLPKQVNVVLSQHDDGLSWRGMLFSSRAAIGAVLTRTPAK